MTAATPDEIRNAAEVLYRAMTRAGVDFKDLHPDAITAGAAMVIASHRTGIPMTVKEMMAAFTKQEADKANQPERIT
jgi:hypothetical protein